MTEEKSELKTLRLELKETMKFTQIQHKKQQREFRQCIKNIVGDMEGNLDKMNNHNQPMNKHNQCLSQ